VGPSVEVLGIPDGGDLDLIREAIALGAAIFLTRDSRVIRQVRVLGAPLKVMPPNLPKQAVARSWSLALQRRHLPGRQLPLQRHSDTCTRHRQMEPTIFPIRVGVEDGKLPASGYCDIVQPESEPGSGVADRFRFVDLFAGLGGFHVALESLGGSGVFAAEWDPTLNALYKDNFGITAWADINDLDSAEAIARNVPDHDILTAGFPCQPFSKAGEQLGFSHTLQGRLFFRVLAILNEKHPRGFILENVPNILRHRGGETLKTMKTELKKLGYSVEVHTYSPHDFGVPQIRERAYFVGSLDGLVNFQWPTPDRAKTDVGTVLDKTAKPVREIPSQTLRAIDMWDDFLKRSPDHIKLPSFPIWAMEFGATYPFEDATPPAIWKELRPVDLGASLGSFGFSLRGLSEEEQFALLPSHSRRPTELVFPKWKQAFIRQNREFYLSNQGWIGKWMEKWQPWTVPSSLQKFEWNVQGGERRIDKYVLQMRASGVRVKRTTTAPSLIAMTNTQVPILGKDLVGQRRYMTPAECAALQSLEGLTLPVSNLHAYKALGNAVNAQVVRAIAAPLLQELESPRSAAERARTAA
jgi:DNA (cytosine-5)-methyltransferase 1